MTGSKLGLTDEERRALLQLLEEELRDPPYPFSPDTEALRRVAEKLGGEDKHRTPRR